MNTFHKSLWVLLFSVVILVGAEALERTVSIEKKYKDSGNGLTSYLDSLAKVRKLGEQANIGNVQAMHDLGALYYFGTGVPQDFEKARHWFEKAANLDFPYSFLALALIYHRGEGVEKNSQKAIDYIKKIEKKGGTPSLFCSLGVLYNTGYIVEKNDKKAVLYYEKAIARGDERGLARLGVLYFDGSGTKKDEKKGLELLQKAAKKGDPEAFFYLGVAHEINKDFVKARKFYENAVEKGYFCALIYLGDLYYNGNGVPQDFEKATAYFKKAADAGVEEAKANLKKVKRRKNPLVRLILGFITLFLLHKD